jgi:L-seryl-tRNA(Ser) seleniumtransferase
MLPDPEIPKSLNDRRSFIKMMAAAPLFFAIASRSLADTVAAAKAKPLGANVYSRLGVRPFINGRGTWTYLSGSLELPEGREAAEQASKQFSGLFSVLSDCVGKNRWVPQVSLLRPGIPATNLKWKPLLFPIRRGPTTIRA